MYVGGTCTPGVRGTGGASPAPARVAEGGTPLINIISLHHYWAAWAGQQVLSECQGYKRPRDWNTHTHTHTQVAAQAQKHTERLRSPPLRAPAGMCCVRVYLLSSAFGARRPGRFSPRWRTDSIHSLDKRPAVEAASLVLEQARVTNPPPPQHPEQTK